MDLDDIEAHREPLIYPDEDTGSAYETTSEEEQSSSHDEQAILTRSSRASSVRSRGKKTTRRETFEFEDEDEDEDGEQDEEI